MYCAVFVRWEFRSRIHILRKMIRIQPLSLPMAGRDNIMPIYNKCRYILEESDHKLIRPSLCLGSLRLASVDPTVGIKVHLAPPPLLVC